MQRSHKMSRCFLSLMAGTALLISLPAHAEDAPPPPPPGAMMMEGPMHKGPPETLAEARQRAKERLDVLNSMTEEQWQENMKIRQQMKDKWQNMSPEEKEAAKTKMKQWKNNHEGHGMKPPAGDTPPAAVQ